MCNRMAGKKTDCRDCGGPDGAHDSGLCFDCQYLDHGKAIERRARIISAQAFKAACVNHGHAS